MFAGGGSSITLLLRLGGIYMKKLIFLVLVLVALDGSCALPIFRTKFRKAPVETVVQYAEKGHAEAQLELALRYYAGHQVSADAEAAFRWMNRAAAQRNPKALYLVCLMHAEGVGTPVDAVRFEQCLAEALAAVPDDGKVRALYEAQLAKLKTSEDALASFLQRCSEAGYKPAYIAAHGQKAVELYAAGKYEEALPLLRKLSETGDAGSSFCLAEMYAGGLGGLPADASQAAGLYLKAARGGHAEAQFRLARALDSGLGGANHAAEVTHWLEQSAQGGHVAAQFALAERALAEARKLAASLEWMRPGKEGYVETRRNYEQNLSRAIKGCQRAAEAGYVEAQYMMGRLCASGVYVLRDYKKALHFYTLAADQGHADALFYLGLMHHAGLGLKQDVPRAFALYEQAAERGSMGAGYYLGNCYRFGVGAPQSRALGESWYAKKVLAGASVPLDGAFDVPAEAWVLEAAREQGVILWHRGAREAAQAWMAWAAKYGTPGARDMLRQMIKNPEGIPAGAPAVIRERRSLPGRDALADAGGPGPACAYLLEEVTELYGTKPPEIISQVTQPRKLKSEGSSTRRLYELSVRYTPPSAAELAGHKGVVLVGVEFEDARGEKYLAFNEFADSSVAVGDDSEIDLYVSITAPAPRVRVTGWSVLYGRLHAECGVLAVLDARSHSMKTDDFERLFLANHSLPRLKSAVTRAVVDIDSLIEEALIDDSDEDGSILGKIIDYLMLEFD